MAGASSYPRIIDFKEISEIAKAVGAYFMVDMAHIAGLVAAKQHPNPVLYADFVTSTTHKTLRGPRGGIILCKEKYAKQIDQAVFPGIQGGPLMHVVAGKAVCFYEALQPEFVEYQKQVIANAKTLANHLSKLGAVIVTGGTDNHLLLINVKKTYNLTGNKASEILDSIHITCNKNSIPFDDEKPYYTSGIRLGTPAMTTVGFKEDHFIKIAEIIHQALSKYQDETMLSNLKKQVKDIMKDFKIHGRD